MKKLIYLLFFMLFSLMMSAQTTVTLSDGDLYLSRTKLTKDSLYKVYLNESSRLVSRLVTQIGKVRVLKQGKYYIKPDGSYKIDPKYAPIWYPIGTSFITIEVNQAMVTRSYSVKEPFRKDTSEVNFKEWLIYRYK